MMQKTKHFFREWTLFLDRDGVLNSRPGAGYLTNPDDLQWIPDSLDSLVHLAGVFRHIVVVTNQQGIGKGLMNAADLNAIHDKMMYDVQQAGGRIDKIYHAAGLRCDDSYRRKPGVGMALEAKSDFPGIRFDKSLMAGDTFRDMLFGHHLGMLTILISQQKEIPRKYYHLAAYRFDRLKDFTNFILAFDKTRNRQRKRHCITTDK